MAHTLYRATKQFQLERIVVQRHYAHVFSYK